MNKTYFYFTLFASILLGTFALTSCGSDPDPVDYKEELYSKLKAYKWTFYSEDVNIYSDTHVSVENTTETLYFMDNNQGYYYVRYKDDDNAVGKSSREDWVSFTYTSYAENSVRIVFSHGSTMTLNYMGGFLINGGEVYKSQTLASNDIVYKYMKWKDLEYNIATKVKLVAYDKGYFMRFEFTSSLGKAYPNNADEIEYGVDYYIADYENSNGVYGENTNAAIYTVDAVVPEALQIYLRVKELKEKSSLNSDERQFIKDSEPVLKKYAKEVEYKPFIQVDGKKYNIDYEIEDEGLNFNEDDPIEGPQKDPEVSYSDGILTVNEVQYEMVSVPGGTFLMGGGTSLYDNNPIHYVTLSSYFIGQTEVTQALWQAIMGINPSEFKGDNLPVEQVSWKDCQMFISKLNQLTGMKFRLPTEAEWEYAARGGKNSKGYKYSGSNTLGDVAWYDNNSFNETHFVATKQANELGLYDMSGNVSEWCHDWYNANYYRNSPSINPTGPSAGYGRVYRGGSYIYGSSTWCRVYERSSSYMMVPDWSATIGLRLAL